MAGLSFSQPHSALRRVPLLRHCRIRGARVDHPGIVCNLSFNGAFVAIEPAPRVGEAIVISLQLPEGERPLTMDAVVCWDNSRRAARGLPPGCGLMFLAPTTADRERIADVVRSFHPHH